MAWTELKISKSVAAGQKNTAEVIPANGKRVTIGTFQGEAAFTAVSSVMLIWDYGGAGEICIWTVKGSGSMPFKEVLTDADGTKKLAVCLDNGEAAATTMSGFADIYIED